MEENQSSEKTALEGGGLGQPPDDHPMNAFMEEALSFQSLKRGDIVNGIIVSVTPTEVLVDVNAKSEGVVPGKELERLGREGLESLNVGDTIPVYVVRPEDRDGNLILSLRRAEEEGDWQEAQTRFEAGDWFESQVAGFNKGGLIVRLGKLRGFVPASQLSPQHQGSNKQQPEERWARLVGIQINVKIIEINRKRRRLILSERAALRQWRDAQKDVLLDELRVGEVRQGTVSSLSDFGAFVDLGGADGLVHLSELSWNRAAQPRDVLRVGQQVEVYVLNVDPEKKRIALSLKRLEPEPWTTVESRYYVGQLVEGTITRLANFGAFALVNDEIEGLIHISELSSGRLNHPREVVQEREKHVMRIIRIDPRKRRMGLSLKRVADPAYADLDWRAELAEAEADLDEETADIMQASDSLVGEEPAPGLSEVEEFAGEEVVGEPADESGTADKDDSAEGAETVEAAGEEEVSEMAGVAEKPVAEAAESDVGPEALEAVEPVMEPDAAVAHEDDSAEAGEIDEHEAEEELPEMADEPDEPAADEVIEEPDVPVVAEEDLELLDARGDSRDDEDVVELSEGPGDAVAELEAVQLEEEADLPPAVEAAPEPVGEPELTAGQGEVPEVAVDDPLPSEADEETEST